MVSTNMTVTDAVMMVETEPVVNGLWAVLAEDTISCSYLLDVLRVFTMPALADGVGVAPAEVTHRGIILQERLALNPDLLAGWLSNVSVSDTVGLARTLLAASPVALADTLGIELSQATQTALTMIETLGLAEAVVGGARYGVTLGDTLRLATSLGNFFHLEVSDTLELAEALVVARVTYNALSDTLGLEATLTPQLLLYATLSDGFDITLEQTLSMILSGSIEDGVEIAAAYVSPAGSLTTWAMNTRTGAVTEYDNFEFNSFARSGSSYLGASSAGLYELLGDDADGTDIIPRLRSGYLQFGGTHLSRLKAAYMATRGEGDFVLRIEESTGAQYNYAVSTRNMRTTKVHMGKGQRARYFLFELIGTGADFDLDTLEFVPIVLQRRV